MGAFCDEMLSETLVTPMGRPPAVAVSTEEAAALRNAYVRSNATRGSGSMAGAAVWIAAKGESPLNAPVRQAIRTAHHANRAMPVEVRRALRASPAAVAYYRDGRAIALHGPHATGCMRLTQDPETGIWRRYQAGECWSMDDGSVNFNLCVPWPWGGDPCSEKWGVRIGRFQFLPALDSATNFCPGWGFAVRMRDSYRSEDIVWTMSGIMRACGYMPRYLTIEGGAWQADRTIAFLDAAGLDWIDTKGRPRGKLVENWFNDLWTTLSMETDGQIGRFRGEMLHENQLAQRCREGSIDPRKNFPMLEPALNSIERAVAHKNTKMVHSSTYGSWIPSEMHAAGIAAMPRAQLATGLEHLCARERHELTVRRFGQVAATADSPLGERLRYHFAAPELAAFQGAKVWVHFDPFAERVTATCALAHRFADQPEGAVICRNAPTLSMAPVVRRQGGVIMLEFSDAASAAVAARKAAQQVVRRELRAVSLDGQRTVAVSEISAPDVVQRQVGIGSATAITDNAIARAMERTETNMDELEAFERANCA